MMIKTASGIWKMWPLLLVILVTGVIGYGCAQPQPTSNLPLPKVYPYKFIVSSGWVSTKQPEIIEVEANEGDTIRVMFSVSGFLGNDIDFSMKDPAGGIVYDKLRIPKEFRQDFPALTTGTYQLLFEDNFSLFRRTITLTILVFPKS
jgi:hypothetical protein